MPPSSPRRSSTPNIGVPLTTAERALLPAARWRGGHLDELTRSVFFPGGDAPPAGTIIKQPMLAETFRRVVDGGMDAFYRGPIAREIVAAVQCPGRPPQRRGPGGIPALLGSAHIDRLPRLHGSHSRHRRAPASSICRALKLLERFDIAGLGHNSAEAIHIMLEAMKLAIADRIHYASLGADCPTDELLSRGATSPRGAR